MGKPQFALSDEQRQVEHLIDYSNTLTDSPWSYEGEVVAGKGGKSLRYDGRASWAEHHGDCVLTGQYAFGEHLLSNGSYGVLATDAEYVALSGADGSWRTERSNVTQRRSSTETGETLTLRLFDVGTGYLDAATPSHGIVLGGVDLAD